jgi:hypothetical protein
MMAAALQDIDEALQIGIHVVVRMPKRMAHAGLGREMHHHREFFRRKQRGDRGAVGEIELDETKPFVTFKLLESRLLERRIVIRRQAVEADNRVPSREQPARHMRADEAGCSRHQDGLVGHRRQSSIPPGLPARSGTLAANAAATGGPTWPRPITAISHPFRTRKTPAAAPAGGLIRFEASPVKFMAEVRMATLF